jgi:hypothetical protein
MAKRPGRWDPLRFVGLASLLLSAALAPDAPGQEHRLLLVTDGSAATAFDSAIDDEEILSVVPGHSLAASAVLNDGNWPVLLGDQNRNGRFDDVPSEIDALELGVPGESNPSVFDLVLSLRTDRDFIDGTRVRDGDAFSLLPGGGVRIVIPESQFQAWVGTRDDVDLDALAFLADGSIAFSFDEPVACAHASIAAQNGGSPIVDNEAVFVRAPGRDIADLALSGPEVVALVNRMLGTTYRSVLQLQGLAEDPSEPGALLFSTGLFSGLGASLIFTTARGGAVASLNGVPLDASAFGFLDPEDIGDFCVLPIGSGPIGRPLSLDIRVAEPSRSVDGEIRLVLGGPAGKRVRVLASRGSNPLPIPQRVTSLGGARYLFLDAADPLFLQTARLKRLVFTLDATGTGEASLPLRNRVPIGTILLFQAIRTDRTEASYAVAARILP